MQAAIPVLIEGIVAARIFTSAAIAAVAAWVASALKEGYDQASARKEAEKAVNDLLLRVSNWMSTSRDHEELDTNDIHHIIGKKDHRFSKECGIPCVLKAFASGVLVSSYQIDHQDGRWVMSVRGTCSHGCTVVVRFSLPKDFKSTTKCRIATAYHDGECRVG